MSLTPRDIIHPQDLAALEKLEAFRLFPALLSSFMKVFDERFLHRVTGLHYIHLGPKQLPEIYELLVDICQRLHLHVPQLYLEVHHEPFSYTLEASNRYIILSTSLLDKLSMEEVRTTLAHECGHIFFNHVLYRTMTKMLVRYGSDLPRPLSTLSMPARIALLYWFLRSEQSADRIAAIVAGDIQPVVETLFHTTETPANIVHALDLQSIREQAKDLNQHQDSTIQRLVESMMLSDSEHPFTTSRIAALMEWGETAHFQHLLSEFKRNPSPDCQQCHYPLHYDDHHCHYCGEMNPDYITINHG